MLTFVAFVLSFIASTLAYQITFPNSDSGWTNQGSQTIIYNRVSTDLPCTIVLVDQALNTSEQLIAQATPPASGSVNNISITVSPPSGGWVVDNNYRVRFMAIPTAANGENTGIDAESGTFSISASSTTLSGTATDTSGSTISVPTATTTGTDTTPTSDSSASDSAAILPTSSSSSADALSYPIHTGLLGLFSLLGFALA